MDEPAAAFLGTDARVPVDRPFARALARSEGVTDRQLATWVAQGLLLNPMRGVFFAAQLPDGLGLRLSCLELVVPDDAVVTGRTAGWVHGAPMILAPGDHLKVPPVSMHLRPGRRLRNPLTVSGERTFLSHEVLELEGIAVTSKLRTTVDLGMGLRRGAAFAAMCAMAKVADFEREELRFEIRERGRFAGYRGVCQIRALEPFVDARYGSAPECLLGLTWWEQTGMPPLTLQHPVEHPDGVYYIDLSCPELRYGVEYKGPRWHGEDRAAYDARRLAWLVDDQGWIIDELVSEDVYGHGCDPGIRMKRGVEKARHRYGVARWAGQNRDGDSWLG